MDFFKEVTFRNVILESGQLFSLVRFREFPSFSLRANPGWVKAEDQTAKVLILSCFIRHVVKGSQNVHLKFVVHFFKALFFAFTRWSSGSWWDNVSFFVFPLQPMYNGVLTHVSFPPKKINKLIKTRKMMEKREALYCIL